MGTTAAILTLLAALVPFLIWAYKRHVAEEENPVAKKAKTDEEIDHAIATDDVDAINKFVHNKLQNKGSGDSSGPSNPL
jgi:uncharacterized protein YpmS